MNEKPKTQVCVGCGNTFEHTLRKGHKLYCSTKCRLSVWQKERRKKQPETVRAEGRLYHHKHKATRILQQKQYRATHKKERSEQMRRYYAEHPEIREKRKQYHLDHKDEHNAKVRLQNQKTRVTHPWRELLHAAKSRARIKNVPFALTKEWAEARWTGRCELTGLEFKLGLTGSGPQVWSPSIDRIKPALGYTPDNCRFILLGINIFKQSGTDADMIVMAKALVKSSMKSKT